MNELTVLDLLDIFLDNIKVMLIVIILGIICGIVYTAVIIVPMYESSTKIILVKPNEQVDTVMQGQSSTLTVNDIMFNQKLVSTYSEIIKSRKVLDEVIERLKLDISPQSIAKNITIAPVKDSEVINITVVNEEPQIAADIANEIVTVFAKQVNEIYKIENVNQVDRAISSDYPYNVNLIKNIILFGLLAFMITYVILFLIEYLRTTLRSPDDIEKIEGLSLLAIIPDANRVET